ncbi:DUF4312 family protein [Paenibacillus frigoriresistens]|uniref:DUF4312 family protein n=1 Tax=Paenibacillus alginolyticus TaxID=59839 RepID=UPI00156476BA|nr:DUF4312 family protein [Paenibacillus frigoriresistens]NRF95851.1 DUF4312 family protein [Paenibacillus frigoriresistens]
MYQEMDYAVTVTGSAETKAGAFQRALSQMKTTISKQIPDILLQIEPQDVEVISATESKYTERFLGFFFPRTRIRYDIKVKISVKLRLVQLSAVTFEQQEEQLPPLQRVLKMR